MPLTQVEHLSGGELQRVALCVCLGKPADVYLIDEPSAYLDSEQRVTASKVRACVLWWCCCILCQFPPPPLLLAVFMMIHCPHLSLLLFVFSARCPSLSCLLPPPPHTHTHLCAQVIKRFILHAKKTAFIVEHDFIMVRCCALVNPSSGWLFMVVCCCCFWWWCSGHVPG